MTRDSPWPEVPLGDLLNRIEAGQNFKCEARAPVDGEIGIVKVSAVTWGEYDEEETKTVTDGERINGDLFVRPGDFLFSRANTIELVGACVIAKRVTKKIMLSDKILRFHFKDVEPSWVLYFLRSERGRRQIEALATGNQESMRNIGQDRIRSIVLPRPPAEEQRAVLAELEKQLTRVEAGGAALERVQANLKRYRASVLKAACEGRLVPTEAELARRESRDYEPASVLLQRILKDRRRLWEESELAKLKAKGKPPKDDRWKGKYRGPDAPDTSGSGPVPPGWCWVSFAQVAFSQNGRGFPSGEYTTDGVKLLRPGNLHPSGRVEWTDRNTRCMPHAWEKSASDLLVGPGEIVMNLTAQSLKDEFLGRVCLTGPGEHCLLNQRLARLTCVTVDPQYMLYLLKSWRFRRFVDGLNTGSLIQHMFTSQLDDFLFPLPPLAEQARIVKAIESRLSQCEALSQTAETNRERAQTLRQAILAAAFAGTLTCTEEHVDKSRAESPALSRENGSRLGPKSRPSLLERSESHPEP